MPTSRVSCFVAALVLPLVACSSHDDPNAKLAAGASKGPAPSASLIGTDRAEPTSQSVAAAPTGRGNITGPFTWAANSEGDLDRIPRAPAVANDARTLPLCRDDTRKPDGAVDEALTRAGWLLIDGAQIFGGTRVVKGAPGLDGQCRPLQIAIFAFRDTRLIGYVPNMPQARIGNVALRDESFLSLTYDQYKAGDPACCPSLHGSQDFQFTSTQQPAAAASKTASVVTAATPPPSDKPIQPPSSVATPDMTTPVSASNSAAFSEVPPCAVVSAGQQCVSTTSSACPPLPADYRQRGEDETSTQDQRARVAEHFLCETSTDFVLAESLQKRGFTLTVSDPTSSLTRLRRAKNAHDYAVLFGSSIPYYEMIPVTINELLSKGVNVTVNHNGKPHDDFPRPEGGVVHFRRSASDPLPGYTLNPQLGVDSMKTLDTLPGPSHMVLGSSSATPAPWASSTITTQISAVAPCARAGQTSFGSWPPLKASKEAKGWQAKITLEAAACATRIVPINAPEMLVTVGGGAEAKPSLQCTYGASTAGECIEFSAYYRAAFGEANPFAELRRAETNARQQADFGHISVEDGANKITQMRKDFDMKAGQALDELDEHFVDVIAAAKVGQIDVCDQDQETFSSGESVSAALCKPVRGSASALNDPSIIVNKTAPAAAPRSTCPTPPEEVDSALDVEKTTQADRHAYLVSKLCARFTPDVRLSPLLAARGYTLRMVDKSGVVEGARKAVASGDTSIAFSQPLLPTYRQINFRLQELEYRVNPWYFVLHNGGRHDLIGGKTNMVSQPGRPNIEIATLSIAALCEKKADAHSIEVPSLSGGQLLEDGSGWQLGASHSSSCVQYALAFPPAELVLPRDPREPPPLHGFCSYGFDSLDAPCRFPGQFYNVVRHAHPDADAATIATFFDTAYERFEQEFLKTYGTPVRD